MDDLSHRRRRLARAFFKAFGYSGLIRKELFLGNAECNVEEEFQTVFAPELQCRISDRDVIVDGQFRVTISATAAGWLLLILNSNEGMLISCMNLGKINPKTVEIKREPCQISGWLVVTIRFRKANLSQFAFILQKHVPKAWKSYLQEVRSIGKYNDQI